MKAFLVCIMFAVFACGQAPKLPADVDAQSYSRLPFLKHDQVSGETLRVWELLAKGKDLPSMGPQATSFYSPGVAEPMDQLNQYLRKTVVGPAAFQICSLLAARAYDENYEWASHEQGAKRENVDPKTIEAIRVHGPLDGLPEKEALIVRFGRALLEDHAVSPELYAKVVGAFGKQGMFELSAVIGDYVMAAIMLRAVDQHVPNPPAPLPLLRK
jgi:hypothetical protein